MNGTKVDDSDCFIQCEGMDVISYNVEEVDSALTRHIKFEANPQLHRHISKLSKIYYEYKGSFDFTPEFKVKFNLFLCYL